MENQERLAAGKPTVSANDISSKRHQRNNHLINKSHTADKQAALGSNQDKVFVAQNHGKENHSSNQIKSNSDQSEQKFCFECNRSLAKSRHLINIAGQLHKWHPECFRCHVCNNLLESESSCHVYKDKIFCRHDYAKLQRDNSTKCTRCRWPIAASDWVRKAGKFVYHLACFTCDICLRQLNTGEQFTVDIQEKELVRLLCQLHFAVNQYQQQEDGQPPPYDLQLPQSAANKHISAAIINESSFVSRSTTSSPNGLSHNQILRFEPPPPLLTANFCEREQHQQHSLKGFQQANFNRDQYLHLLAAATNNVSNNNVDCPKQSHNLDLEFNSSSDLIGNRQAIGANISCQLQLDNELPMTSQHQILTRRPGPISSSSSSSNGSSSTSRLIGGSGHPSKSKRVRTTFTEHQLDHLQRHFQIDSNPDGQDLERIATITGLSKRVTQVWFQNSRARQKKYMIKRKPASGSLSSAVGAHVLTPGGSASANQHSTNHLFMQSTNRILSEQQPLVGVAIKKENYQTGEAQAATSREKSWPANLSDRSELSLDEQAAMDDLDDNDDDSSVSSNNQRDDEESENDIIDHLEDEEEAE